MEDFVVKVVAFEMVNETLKVSLSTIDLNS